MASRDRNLLAPESAAQDARSPILSPPNKAAQRALCEGLHVADPVWMPIDRRSFRRGGDARHSSAATSVIS
ncbi:hypothetical protein BV511_02720 [Methylorubrum extorquens]|nr:hypothetical protein BV511_02720 [Methylorubrum extorquens]